jgi:hypothetical protein
MKAGVPAGFWLGSARRDGKLAEGLPQGSGPSDSRRAPSSLPAPPGTEGALQLVSAEVSHGAERTAADGRGGGVTTRCACAWSSAAISVAAAAWSITLVRCRLRARAANATLLAWTLAPPAASMARRWNPPTSDSDLHGDVCPDERGDELPRLSKPVHASGLGEDVPRRSRCARPLPPVGEVRWRLLEELAKDPP